MGVKPKFELVKIVCHTVAIERDGDRIIAEHQGPAVACYSTDDFTALYEKAVTELAAASAPPPRAARRKS